MDHQEHLDWNYRAEGNCSLVVYNQKLGRAYRILKVRSKSIRHINQHNTETIEKYYFSLVQFAACVVERLFGDYIDVPVMKTLSVRFMEDLSVMIQDSRPDGRQGKDMCLCPVVLDMPDYAYIPSIITDEDLPSFMFELKPGSVARRYSTDQQFIPCSEQMSCYYCVNKTVECQTSDKRLSRYCPQELFSGSTNRMRRSVKYLLEDINCTRNRLRFFKNGVDQTCHISDVDDLFSLLHPYFNAPTKATRTSMLTDILIKCLTSRKIIKKMTMSPINSAVGDNRQTNRHQHNDYSSSILSVFAAAQQFGASTLADVERAYNTLITNIEQDPSIEEKLCINGPYDTGLWRLGVRPQLPTGISEDLMSAFITVRNYLTYRTAKDCSILLTLHPFQSTRKSFISQQDRIFTVIDSTEQMYLCSAAIVDLDPKPFSKMKQYIASERRIESLYQSSRAHH